MPVMSVSRSSTPGRAEGAQEADAVIVRLLGQAERADETSMSLMPMNGAMMPPSP